MEKAKKSLGQHFLIDKNIRNKIIKILKLNKKKILEIGPGTGFLTDAILNEKPEKIILIEKDKKLFKKLYLKYKSNKKIKLYNKDFLDIDLSKFNNYIIISNLPYNITKKFLYKLIFNNIHINESVVMIQKEVAKKINPKEKGMNKYKFLINLTSSYHVCFEISQNVFFPKPKVKSCVVRIKSKKIFLDKSKIHYFLNKIFNNKRKILNNLLPFKIKNKKGLLKKRVENLKFEELKYLLNMF